MPINGAAHLKARLLKDLNVLYATEQEQVPKISIQEQCTSICCSGLQANLSVGETKKSAFSTRYLVPGFPLSSFPLPRFTRSTLRWLTAVASLFQ